MASEHNGLLVGRMSMLGENSDGDSNIPSARFLYLRYGIYYLLNIQFYYEKNV